MQELVVLKQADGSFLFGYGIEREVEFHQHFNEKELEHFLSITAGDFRFCTISYQLGYEFLGLKHQRKNNQQFPLLKCWTAISVYSLSNKQATLLKGNENDQQKKHVEQFFETKEINYPQLQFQAQESKAHYLSQLKELKRLIQLGEIYEVNYCQNFEASCDKLESIAPYFQWLHAKNPTPFAAMVDFPEWKLASASPERFIQKLGNRIISQPIKGTSRRSIQSEEDEALKSQLRNSTKERAENVMIVDLVRNDLSKIAQKGSVQVDELCGIYSYPTVHQMISTISCTVDNSTTFSSILEALFPMGSMTGAPKKAAVSIATQLESFNRELYSGSIGVIYPNNDFDFNVLIRSLTYHTASQKMSCAVGGAITILSDPEDEYEECKTKIAKILELFGTCRW
jgi:para-aminobenzoate synthetase component 1